MSNAKNPTFAEEFVHQAMNTPEAMTAMYEQDPRPPVRSDVLTTVSAKDADMAKLAAGARNATLLPDFPFMAGVWPHARPGPTRDRRRGGPGDGRCARPARPFSAS
jgi:maltose-binding protein MalE